MDAKAEIHGARGRAWYMDARSLDFDFDEALRGRRMTPIFAGLVKTPGVQDG